MDACEKGDTKFLGKFLILLISLMPLGGARWVKGGDPNAGC
jgi:hypothetical protein